MLTRKITRRSLLRAAVRTSIFCSGSAALGLGYSIYGEPGWLDLTYRELPLAGLAPHALPITVAQLTDIHLSESIRAEHVAEAVALVNQQRPDIVVLTGDYVSHGTGYMRQVGAILGELRAPLGVYAVLGNHDHWSGAATMHAALADNGIRVLRNEHQRIDLGEGPLWLVGVDDVMEKQHDLAQALHGVPADGARLLLAHEPDFADTAADYGIGLQLSGHSHGGQVRLPLIGAPIVPPLSHRYPIGLRRVPGRETLVYTSRGIGVVAPPVRFNCRPEVTLLTLRPANVREAARN